jgi:hypothetical protein
MLEFGIGIILSVNDEAPNTTTRMVEEGYIKKIITRRSKVLNKTGRFMW